MKTTLRRANWLIGGLLTAACFLTSCVGYTATPLSAEESVFSDPNAPATRDVAAKALRWTIWRYPPEGGDGRITQWQENEARAGMNPKDIAPRVAINLPAGLRPELYEELVRRVGNGAVPLTPETAHLPTYHLGRVYILGDQASVDVIRPVPEFGTGPDGYPVYQGITVRMRGGLKPWTAQYSTPWTIGVVKPPALNYYVAKPTQPVPVPEAQPGEQPATPEIATAHEEPPVSAEPSAIPPPSPTSEPNPAPEPPAPASPPAPQD